MTREGCASLTDMREHKADTVAEKNEAGDCCKAKLGLVLFWHSVQTYSHSKGRDKWSQLPKISLDRSPHQITFDLVHWQRGKRHLCTLSSQSGRHASLNHPSFLALLLFRAHWRMHSCLFWSSVLLSCLLIRPCVILLVRYGLGLVHFHHGDT